MQDARAEREEPDIRIREEATPAEVAAVVAAIRRAREDNAPPRTPPWLRAALREGLGGRPAAEPSDLR